MSPNGILRPENRTDIICAFCGAIVVKMNVNMRYCSPKCRVKFDKKRYYEKHILKKPDRFCEKCGVLTGKNRHQRWCRECAPFMYALKYRERPRKERVQMYLLRVEYQDLLADSDKLGLRGFHRLLVLAEMLGRDLDEWISESENLRELQARLRADQQLFDEGERRKVDCKNIPKDKNHEYHDTDEYFLRSSCGCQWCKAGKAAALKRRYGGEWSERKEGGNPAQEPQGGEDADKDNPRREGDEKTGAGCDAGRVAEPNREKKKEEKVIG